MGLFKSDLGSMNPILVLPIPLHRRAMSTRPNVVQVHLDDDAFHALSDLARLTGEAKRSLVRRAVTEHLQSSGYAHLVSPKPTATTLAKKEKYTHD
jgi:hypothetical protein